MSSIDADLAIAQTLQRDGRASNAELGRAAGLSANAAATRMARMIDSRELSIVTLVRAGSVRRVHAHVSVQVGGAALPVGLAAARLSATSFASLTVGRYPLVVELRCTDQDELRAQLDRVRRIRGVSGIDVVVADEVIRDSSRTTGADKDVMSVDDIDEALVAALRSDGRASFAALAERCGLSPAATRVRVMRLLDSGAVHVTALLAHGRMQSMSRLGVGLVVVGQTASSVARGLLGLSGLVFAMTGVGRFDVIAGIDASGDEAALRSLDRIRQVKGVASLESWRHHDVLRERYD